MPVSNSQRRAIFLQAVRQCIGMPYRWGGQSYAEGFDCSGLVLYGLKQVGIKLKDMRVSKLFEEYADRKVTNGNYKPGCLIFYGDSPQKISHVMIVLTIWEDKTMILMGARGGNSETTTLAAARKQKAFVDVCFGDYWYQNIQCVVDPFKI